jgi:PKD repeat protein
MKKQAFRLSFLVFLFTIGGCKKNEPIPKADFNITGTNNFYAPCTVSFINKSENAFSYDWSFAANDSIFSTDTNAVHVFTVSGSYDIKLRAYTQSRKEWASSVKTIKILQH